MRYNFIIIAMIMLFLGSCSEPTYKLVTVPVLVEKPVIKEVEVPTLTGTLVMDWPIQDHDITSPFGYRGTLKKNGIGGSMLGDSIHNGVDIVPSDRTLIHALIHTAAPGVVMYVFTARHQNALYGISVLVQHDTGMRWTNGKPVYIYTLYGHLSELWVVKGEVLKRGDVIGRMGNTGEAQGYHLHFAVLFDPQDFLS